MKLKLNTLAAMAAVGILGAVAVFQRSASAGTPVTDTLISPVKAMGIAEGATGGKAGMAIYEFDDGHWIYSVPVAKGGKLSEVEINPVSGKVLETESVDAKSEAKEFAQSLEKLAKTHN